MAPPERAPNPDHPAVDGLDPAVADHRGEIVAWVEWLLHPEEHSYDRAIVYAPGYSEEAPGNKPRPEGGHYPFHSVIEGRHLEQFFDPAFALSGQAIGQESAGEVEVEPGSVASLLFTSLDDARWKNNDFSGRIVGGFQDIREQCAGTAVCAGGGLFTGGVLDYAANFEPVAKELEETLAAYGALIIKARKALDEAMGALVDAFHTKFYVGGIPAEKFTLIGLNMITAAMGTIITGGTGAAVWGSALVAFAGKTTEEAMGAQVAGSSWWDLVSSYFHEQMTILDGARTEIGKLGERLARLPSELPEVPRCPRNPA